MSDDKVKHFYAHSLGWNMFDSKFLTPDLEAFLDQESDSLSDVFSKYEHYNHLVEVGCGYGRYLSWATSRKLAYDGLDLVPWLIHIGELRIERMQRKNPKAVCAVHNLSAEKLGNLLHDPMANRRDWSTLVFFPFNCFGNIASLREVMQTLQQSRCDVYISTFQLDGMTTELRSSYYANCGYRRLQTEMCDEGLLITSEEGLHAYAYSKDYLTELFHEYGFHLMSVELLGRIGVGYHFVKVPMMPHPEVSTLDAPGTGFFFPVSLEKRRSSRVETEVSITLSVLHEELTEASELSELEPEVLFSGLPEPGCLLVFENYTGLTRNISLDGVLVQSETAWPEGSIVKLELNWVGEPMDLEDPLLFIGIIVRVEELPTGEFETAIRFEHVPPHSKKRLSNKIRALRS